jgi:hypothetical protein
MTLTIDLINSGALNLLQDMERLNLIRVHPEAYESGVQEPPPPYMAEQTAAEPEGSLSERFAGALRLSDEKYAAFQNALQEGRSEWERDIY